MHKVLQKAKLGEEAENRLDWQFLYGAIRCLSLLPNSSKEVDEVDSFDSGAPGSTEAEGKVPY